MSRDKNMKDAKRWLLTAQADVKAASALSQAGMFSHACFNAQQSAEKAVKALLYFYDLDPWGHSVVKLLENLKKVEGLSSSLIEMFFKHARFLDKLYIPTRYPDGLPDELSPADVFTKEDAKKALDAALEVIRGVEKNIAGNSHES